MLQDLRHAVDLRRDNRKVDMQKLTIIYHGADEAGAELRVRYAMNLDAWTSSYRMILPADPSENNITLEGHAILENMQMEDWSDIKLVVAAGAPALSTGGSSDGGGDADDDNESSGYAGARKGSSGITVFIKKAGGSTLTLRGLADTVTVYDLKTKISSREGIPCGQQRLIFAGKQLEDGRTLSDYNISREATVHLIKKTTGSVSDFRTQRAAPSARELQPRCLGPPPPLPPPPPPSTAFPLFASQNFVKREDYVFCCLQAAPSTGAERQFCLGVQSDMSYYDVENPVSCKRRQAAMVPLMNAVIPAKRVAIFDETVRKGALSVTAFLGTSSPCLLPPDWCPG
eukprot:SAG22_NODE_1131_length_5456_cov_2.950719_5_plen_342_part_01